LLDLVGTKSHREAVGARVEVTAGGVTQTRVKDGSYHRWSHDHTRMHFGMARQDHANITITWPSGTKETYLDVPMNHVYRAVESDKLDIVKPGTATTDPCGLPSDPIIERGVFLGKNCADGTWQARFSSGGDAARNDFTGRIISDAPFDAIQLRAIRDVDVVNTDTPGEISFQLAERGNNWGGVDFRPAAGAKTCFEISSMPDGVGVYLGVLKEPVRSALDLQRAGLCPDSVVPLPPDDGNGDTGGGDTGGNDTGGGDNGDTGGNGNGGGNDNGNSGVQVSGGGGGALAPAVLLALLPMAACGRRLRREALGSARACREQ
jgi:hypothetical protein